MHIADGVLSPEVCIAAGALSLSVVGYSLHKMKSSLGDRTVPLTGMMSALIFAGQMVNFPLLGAPISGHLIGGVLAASVLGPWAGCVAITLVLVVQCVLFADGGILTLGANVLNMAVIGSIGGYGILSITRRLLGRGRFGTIVGAVFASWLTVMAAAALFCLEFRMSWLNSDFQFQNIFTWMVTVHSAIGIGEALITGFAVSFILSQRPDLLHSSEKPAGAVGTFSRALAAGVVVALAVAAFLAPFASDFPDGLEAVAERAGFNELAAEPKILVLDDYKVPIAMHGWQKVSVSLAGIGGTGVVLIIGLLLGRTIKPQAANAEVRE